MKITVIVNPHAGRNLPQGAMALVRKELLSGGNELELLETATPEEGRLAVHSAVEQKSDCIVCAGGDGTLSDAVGWLLEAGGTVPLGYIPAGTTNDFAASLDLPLDPKEAARRILSTPPMPLDAGRMGERAFIYTASFGAFTGTSYSADPALKHALGHLAYVIEGVKELPTIRPYRVEIETREGERFAEEVIFGSMTNSTSLGGVVKLSAQQVDLSDGRFELMLVRTPKSLTEFNRDMLALASGKYEGTGVLLLHTAGARFTFDGDVDWSLDGEHARTGRVAEVQVLHQAYRLHY